jgi:hypothetical protein
MTTEPQTTIHESRPTNRLTTYAATTYTSAATTMAFRIYSTHHIAWASPPRITNYEPRIMQNKPNLPNAQMNVKSFHTVDYENKSNWKLGENKANQSQYKPNTNPIYPYRSRIKPNFKPTAALTGCRIRGMSYTRNSPGRG